MAKAAGHFVFVQAPLHCAAAQVSRRLDGYLVVVSYGLFVLLAGRVVSRVGFPVRAAGYLVAEEFANVECLGLLRFIMVSDKFGALRSVGGPLSSLPEPRVSMLIGALNNLLIA